MRVVYSGTVVSNGGDAAIMEYQIRLLSDVFPVIESAMLDSAPAVAQSIFPYVKQLSPVIPMRLRSTKLGPVGTVAIGLSRRRLLAAASDLGSSRWVSTLLSSRERGVLDEIAGCDFLAYTGGTSLTETYGVEPKMVELELALRLGKPYVFFPQSLGPFHRAKTRRKVAEVVNGAALVLLRDQRSFANLAGVGAHMGNVKIAPDVVFAAVSEAGVKRLRSSPPLEPGMRVAVSVRNVAKFSQHGEQGEKRYESALVELVTWLVRKRGAAVTFVSTCQGLPGYAFDDSRKALEIVSRLEGDVSASVVVDRTFRTPAELRLHYRDFDLLVSTRMHAAILALSVGTPVVPISYEFKTDEVMGRQLGMSSYVVALDRAAEDLIPRTQAFLDDLPSLRAELAERLRDVAELSKQTGRLIEEALA